MTKVHKAAFVLSDECVNNGRQIKLEDEATCVFNAWKASAVVAHSPSETFQCEKAIIFVTRIVFSAAAAFATTVILFPFALL